MTTDSEKEIEESGEMITAMLEEGASSAPSKKLRMPHRPEDIPKSVWEKIRVNYEQGNCDDPEALARKIMEEEETEEKLIPGWRRVNRDLETRCTCGKWNPAHLINCLKCKKRLYERYPKGRKEPSANTEDKGISSLLKPSN